MDASRDIIAVHPRPWRVETDNFFHIVDMNGKRVMTTVYPAGEWFAKLVVDAVNTEQNSIVK